MSAPVGSTLPGLPGPTSAQGFAAEPAGAAPAARLVRPLALVALGASALLVVLWLLAVTGKMTASPPLVGAVAAAALAAGAAAAGLVLVPAARREPRAAAALLLLLGLALASRFIGLRYGLAERYYTDEGVYTRHAGEINAGRLFPDTFIYPHLSFYLQAFTIWLAHQFPDGFIRLAHAAYDIGDWPLAARLASRLVNAVLGALTVVPVFLIGRRLGGTAAGLLGGLLVVASPSLNEGAHVNTCDTPAAFFAALTMLFVARLVERERLGDYLLAGACSGLAAGAKYPAGVVAVAIAAAWLRHRLRDRRLVPGGLLWAGLVSLAAFLAVNPALLVSTREAMVGSNGVLFGLVNYRYNGWVGVIADSNLLFYGRHLLANFGAVAILLGLAGLALTPAATRRTVLWLLPFPVVAFVLISRMNIVVERNLFPLLPLVAALLGLGIAILAQRAARLHPAAGVALALVGVAAPAFETGAQSVRFVRPDTRAEAQRWMVERLPPGALVVREEYTPSLPANLFASWPLPRFAVNVPLSALQTPAADFLLLSSSSYARFFDGRVDSDEVRTRRAEYERIFALFPLVHEVRPSTWQGGPVLQVRRLAAEAPEHARGARLAASTAFVPSKTMRNAPQQEYVYYAHPGQWCALKAHLAAGRYRLAIEGEPKLPATVEVRDLDNRVVATVDLAAGAAGSEFVLPRDDKYFIVPRLAPRSVIVAVVLEPLAD